MMTEEDKRSIVLQVAMSYHGTFYTWGGDDPSGFDCSGLVIECFKSVGILPRKGDWAARDLCHLWRNNKVQIPKMGDVVFWYNHDHTDIVHVELLLNDELSIGASGGSGKVKTLEDAIKYNAFIKIRPFKSRQHIEGFYNPYI